MQTDKIACVVWVLTYKLAFALALKFLYLWAGVPSRATQHISGPTDGAAWVSAYGELCGWRSWCQEGCVGTLDSNQRQSLKDDEVFSWWRNISLAERYRIWAVIMIRFTVLKWLRLYWTSSWGRLKRPAAGKSGCFLLIFFPLLI